MPVLQVTSPTFVSKVKLTRYPGHAMIKHTRYLKLVHVRHQCDLTGGCTIILYTGLVIPAFHSTDSRQPVSFTVQYIATSPYGAVL